VTLFTHDHPQKGQDFGCAAVRRVRELLGHPVTHKDVRFFSAGGNVKPEHRALFDGHYGYLTGRNYVRMFQETDVFIFPSLYEGFPAVPLEAMASGCALVTTRVSGVEEYAVHGKNCMTCLPGEVERMAENILALIEDTALRDTLRENGLRVASNYSWESATDQLVAFLEEETGVRRVPERQEVLAS
jgi:glycosyltransferase involved in cell wall biosynthesis